MLRNQSPKGFLKGEAQWVLERSEATRGRSAVYVRVVRELRSTSNPLSIIIIAVLSRSGSIFPASV